MLYLRKYFRIINYFLYLTRYHNHNCFCIPSGKWLVGVRIFLFWICCYNVYWIIISEYWIYQSKKLLKRRTLLVWDFFRNMFYHYILRGYSGLKAWILCYFWKAVKGQTIIFLQDINWRFKNLEKDHKN